MAKLLVTPHTIVNGRMKQIWAFALVALLVAVISVASSTLLQAESEPTLNLSSLSITDQNGTAIDLGTFDSTVSAYSANVASTVESVTVAATADAGKDAYIYISPGNYVLPGSSGTTASHQIELSHGTNTILISVHSFEIAEPLKTYTLSVSRAGVAPSDSSTTVSVSGLGWARKGSTMPFLLTRTGDTSQSLTVPVNVSETRTKVAPSLEGRREVTFSSGQASVRLDIPTSQEDNFASMSFGDSRLELALVDGAGYDLSADASVANAWVWEYSTFVSTESYRLTSQDGTKLSSHGSVDVETNTERVTLTIIPGSEGSIGTYFLPSDSRPNEIGHQVDLKFGATQIMGIQVPHDREELLKIVEVTINRPGSSSGSQTPSVSIHGLGRGREGERIPFVLTRTGDISQALTVTLDVSETDGDVVPSFLEGRFSVDFKAGYATTSYDLWTDGDANWEEHSAVSVALVDGDDYDLDSQFQSASLTVKDNDVPDMTATLTLDSLEADEGEEITATVTITTDGPKEPHAQNGAISVRVIPGTARFDEIEYVKPGRGQVSVGPSFESVTEDGVVTAYQIQSTVPIRIVDDDRPEPDETFDLMLDVAWLPSDRHDSRGGSIGGLDTSSITVTIPGQDEVPHSPDPLSFVEAVVSDHGASGSAFSVTWEDAGNCPNWYQADLVVRDGSLNNSYLIGIAYRGASAEISGTVDNTEFTSQRDVTYAVRVSCTSGWGTISEAEILPQIDGAEERVAWQDAWDAWFDQPVPTDADGRPLLSQHPLFLQERPTVGYKPLPGTYSSEPPLTGLTVTPGTLGPAFNKNGFLYAVLDVPSDSAQITVNPTAKPGYTISWLQSEDADPDTDGHQVDLDVGYNSIFFKVEDHPFLNSFTYEVIVKRAESNTTGSPSISGTAQVGETLTASTSEIADTDGLTNVSYSYQWIRNDGSTDTDIENATGASYALVDADEGKTIKVKVSFTDDAGNDEALTSAATALVAARPNTPATGAPTISGTVQVGETLAASTSGISDTDGLTGVSYSYQWIRNDGSTDADIQDATDSTYTVTPAGALKTIKVRASFTDDAGNEESVLSDATVQVPAIWTGTVTVGNGPEGSDSTGYSVFAGGMGSITTPRFELDGVTNTVQIAAYSQASLHLGLKKELSTPFILHIGSARFESTDASTRDGATSFLYTWSDPNLSWSEGDSLHVAILEAAANTAAAGVPTISGTAQVGETLTASTSDISDTDGLDQVVYSYQWVSNDGAEDSDISGATSSTYTLVDADEDKTIKVKVTFTDDSGHDETLTSAATAAVAARPNSPATGAPTITGTMQVGETLTTNASGIADADGLSNVQYEYQWLADDADISGATNATYTPAAADEGKAIKVRVSFTDDAGNEESLTSAATDAVAAAPTPNTPATGAPTISGTAQVGETLTADTSGISDTDGLTNVSYSYQWIRNDGSSDTDIQDATGSTYTLVDADEGQTIKVKVTFTDDSGHDETLTSAATEAVEPAGAEPTDRPYGLTATVSVDDITLTWQEPDNFYGPDYHILRHRPEEGEPEPLVYVDFTGTDATTFTDIDVEPGVLYVYQVRATIDMFATLGEPSDPIEARVPERETSDTQQAPNTPATGVPIISGTAQVEETLTSTTSGIADTDGLDNVSYSYQWIRNDGSSDTDIAGATSSTYTLDDADEGQTIKVKVSFTDDAGNDETLTSAATAAVADRPNAPATGAPTISGTAQVGETLTASTSGISDTDGLTKVSYSYQWVRNDGSSDTDIQDATGSSYTLVNADEGKTIKVRVSFTDDRGNEETLTSAATAAVAARPNSPATGTPTISGTAQVGETLTASTSGISDTDGLTNVSYSYQWVRNDGSTDIQDATGSSYTLVDSDEGQTIKVRVSFSDDAGNDETLTSAATSEVAAAPSLLTVSLESSPASHNGTDAFTFQIRFSEEFKVSYRTLRDHAFTVDGGVVTKAARQERGSNLGWTITVEPDSNAAVGIILPATTDCDASGAICTEDGRKLSNSLDFTVSGPN